MSSLVSSFLSFCIFPLSTIAFLLCRCVMPVSLIPRFFGIPGGLFVSKLSSATLCGTLAFILGVISTWEINHGFGAYITNINYIIWACWFWEKYTRDFCHAWSYFLIVSAWTNCSLLGYPSHQQNLSWAISLLTLSLSLRNPCRCCASVAAFSCAASALVALLKDEGSAC